MQYIIENRIPVLQNSVVKPGHSLNIGFPSFQLQKRAPECLHSGSYLIWLGGSGTEVNR